MCAVFSRLSRLSGGFRTSITKRRRARGLHRVRPTRREHAAELQAALGLHGFHLADWRTCLRIDTDAAWVADRDRARGARQPAGTRPRAARPLAVRLASRPPGVAGAGQSGRAPGPAGLSPRPKPCTAQMSASTIAEPRRQREVTK